MGTDNVIGGITVGMKFGTFSGHKKELTDASSERDTKTSYDIIFFNIQPELTIYYNKDRQEIGLTNYLATGDYFVTRDGLTYSTKTSAWGGNNAPWRMTRIDSETHYAIDTDLDGIVDEGEIKKK